MTGLVKNGAPDGEYEPVFGRDAEKGDYVLRYVKFRGRKPMFISQKYDGKKRYVCVVRLVDQTPAVA